MVDLRAQLEVQLGALKRQARQASRYRNISGAIRQAEAELLSIQRARTEAMRSEASAALHAVGRHRLLGGIPVGDVFKASRKIGQRVRRLRPEAELAAAGGKYAELVDRAPVLGL